MSERMTKTMFRVSAIVLAAFGLMATGVGCEKEVPMQTIRGDEGMLSMAIDRGWVPGEVDEDEEEVGLVFRHPRFSNLQLSVEDRVENFGQPLKVLQVKSMLGKQLNSIHGGIVNTKVSLGGNAMIHWAHEVEQDDEMIYTENWVIARPHGWGNIVRAQITLAMPPTMKGRPEVQEMIDALAKQVGDAKLPEA